MEAAGLIDTGDLSGSVVLGVTNHTWVVKHQYRLLP